MTHGEVPGEPGRPTSCCSTSWAIVHIRQWKFQVPYLARHFRVVTVEGRGNGRADRPDDEHAYADDEYVADVLAVLDATGTQRAVLVGLSIGARHALQFAARYPERSAGVIAMGTLFPASYLPSSTPGRTRLRGLGQVQPAPLAADYPGFVEFFMSQVFTGAALAQAARGRRLLGAGHRRPHPRPDPDNDRALPTVADAEATCREVRCPVLVAARDRGQIAP